MIEKRKLLYWEGSSKKDFKEFPVPVQKDMGVSLFVVQLGGTPDSAKPWKGLGSGVYELVEDHRGDTFRAVYTVKIGDAVHVLHAFQKKSKSGIATPQPDVELIEKRLKAVLGGLLSGVYSASFVAPDVGVETSRARDSFDGAILLAQNLGGAASDALLGAARTAFSSAFEITIITAAALLIAAALAVAISTLKSHNPNGSRTE